MYDLYTLMLTNFNPRSREGSDPALPAPPWRSGNFNPRSREGSDRSIGVSSSGLSAFQSTLP